jgi:3-methylcrotonyl-CoA carboxylase alpha subunit
MFRKLLIANRGEIARRIMHTCVKMKILTVAVFSDADRYARHVVEADAAVHLGPSPARDSYLRIEAIIEAAKRTGAEAIHPGYGFLAENAELAEACAAAGIVFVGPSVAAIRAMGSKAEAKRLMAEAGVPLVPGYHGEDQSDALLAAKAAMIGYPVLIKASAGGGGRGMRAVERAEDFVPQLAAARREAEATFGDGRVLLEKYLQRPRHIEVQLLGDTHGTLLHLGTRDCSIQRRHQKIVEEAPAPGLSDATREKIHQAALAAGRAVAYTSAGTVEFIAEGSGPDPKFYFMEMNTRLQVEHPVTEEVMRCPETAANAFGTIDLVELQLSIAAGERLPFAQAELMEQGHAIEVRLCAEDPMHEFRPTTGTFTRIALDTSRVETGYEIGDTMTPHYDNLVAKLIEWGSSRHTARHNLAAGLRGSDVTGVTTNLMLLRRIVEHPSFVEAELDTGFIARHQAGLLPPPVAAPPDAVAAACLAILLDLRARRDARANNHTDPHSLWHRRDGWRLSGQGTSRLVLREAAGRIHVVSVEWQERGWMLTIDGVRRHIDGAEQGGSQLAVRLDGQRFNARVLPDRGDLLVEIGDGVGAQHRLHALDLYAAEGTEGDAADRIAAPIPALVTRVDVVEGDVVKRGQVLAVMEAMKTEIRIAAPADGTVARVLVKPGDMVQEGMELVQLTHDDAKPSA